jgi:hypothetical protein
VARQQGLLNPAGVALSLLAHVGATSAERRPAAPATNTEGSPIMDITYEQVVTKVQGDARLSEFTKSLCLRILDIHQPIAPPEGQYWLSGGTRPHCSGCATGDPFMDPGWPCQTVQSIVDSLDGKPVEPAPEPELDPDSMINFNIQGGGE